MEKIKIDSSKVIKTRPVTIVYGYNTCNLNIIALIIILINIIVWQK